MNETENRVANCDGNNAQTPRPRVRPGLKWTLIGAISAYAALFLDNSIQEWIFRNQLAVLAKTFAGLLGSPGVLLVLGLSLLSGSLAAEVVRRPALVRRWTRLWRLQALRILAAVPALRTARQTN